MNFTVLVDSLIYDKGISGTNWSNTSWTDVVDGKQITVTLKELLTVMGNIRIQNISTKELEPYALHKDKKDKETLFNVEQANLHHPIIILDRGAGKRLSILDGHHRLQKCINNNITYIKAKVIHLNKLPKKYQQVLG